MKKIKTLDGLKSIMIFIIILSHMEFLQNFKGGMIYEKYFHNPFLGVDFFFMMTGFGLVIKYLSRGTSEEVEIKRPFTFAINRAKRFYGTYIISIILMVPYYVYDCLIRRELPVWQIVRNVIIKFGICMTMLQSATGMTRFSNAFNGVCWYISTIFCIYILCPALLHLIKKVKTSKYVVVVLLTTITAILGLNIMFEKIQNCSPFDNIIYGSPYMRVFYVFIGMLVGKQFILTQTNTSTIWGGKNSLELVAVMSAITWFLFRNSLGTYVPNWTLMLVDVSICVLILFTFSYERGLISRCLSGRKMVLIGKTTLPLMIWHYPIRMYIDLVRERVYHGESIFVGILEVAVILLMTYMVCYPKRVQLLEKGAVS